MICAVQHLHNDLLADGKERASKGLHHNCMFLIRLYIRYYIKSDYPFTDNISYEISIHI